MIEVIFGWLLDWLSIQWEFTLWWSCLHLFPWGRKARWLQLCL